jgi:hypothetical protein
MGTLGGFTLTNLVPVSAVTHAGKAWPALDNLAFAAAQAVVPLLGAEFAKVAVSMPIAFIEQAGLYLPVAVMSPIAGRNFFIGASGQWLGGYVPAALRSYPFRLGRFGGAEEFTLCVDEDSGLVVDANGAGEAFFDADGKPSAAAKAMLGFLLQIERGRSHTDLTVAALAGAGLIGPWSLQVRTGGTIQPVNGLLRIDEARLDAIDDATFLRLRHAAALPLAYLQLLSMGQVAVFDRLSQSRQQMAQSGRQQQQISSLDELFENTRAETLRFN